MIIYGIWEDYGSYECSFEGYLEEFFTDKNKAVKYLLEDYIDKNELKNYEWENENKLVNQEEAKIEHLHTFEIKPISIDKEF